MWAIVLNLVRGLYGAALKRSIRRTMLTLALTLMALLAWMVAAGFGLSLAYVWVQRVEGTMPALAITGGVCALLGLVLLFVSLLGRQQDRWRGISKLLGKTSGADQGDVWRMLDEAISTIETGSQEPIWAAAAVAFVTGIMVGRRL